MRLRGGTKVRMGQMLIFQQILSVPGPQEVLILIC